MPNEKNSSDVLGIKPIASSVEKVTDGVVDGARAFLSRVCLPAAEELGLLIKDNVQAWRSRNALKIAQRAEQLLELHQRDTSAVSGNPKVVCQALEYGSWNDDTVVQDFWAGLLASACDDEGGSDSNMVFVSILSQLTNGQVRLIRFVTENTEKYLTPAGWPRAKLLEVKLQTLVELFGTNDVTTIDVALDHLRVLDLTGSSGIFVSGGGFNANEPPDSASINLTSLALNLYLAGEGTRQTAEQFWGLELEPNPQVEEG